MLTTRHRRIANSATSSTAMTRRLRSIPRKLNAATSSPPMAANQIHEGAQPNIPATTACAKQAKQASAPEVITVYENIATNAAPSPGTPPSPRVT